MSNSILEELEEKEKIFLEKNKISPSLLVLGTYKYLELKEELGFTDPLKELNNFHSYAIAIYTDEKKSSLVEYL